MWTDRLNHLCNDTRIVPYYQPIFQCGGRLLKVPRVEVLMRGLAREEEIIEPRILLPLLEESAQYDDAYDELLRGVLNDKVALQNAFGSELIVCINIYAKQLMRRLDCDRLYAFIESMSPLRVEIELSEGDRITNESQLARNLGTLQQFGTQLACDDFSSKWSFIDRLERTPFDTIKIDRGLLERAGSRDVPSIVQRLSAVTLETLCSAGDDYTVVLEGIESQRHWGLAQQFGFENVQLQGFLLARPVSINVLLEQFSQGLWQQKVRDLSTMRSISLTAEAV
ncbi:EAL domain-containing protein [Aliagarivorans taiwanensis]|uniref:EAL domain-containing protein n=1 Tax=Aliagarivorans taiwanensis TaxID=561966 RepID=UPI0004161E9C|nr:EAL domain-containing protein [Aliagarivorans taiwanensis]